MTRFPNQHEGLAFWFRRVIECEDCLDTDESTNDQGDFSFAGDLIAKGWVCVLRDDVYIALCPGCAEESK